MTRYELVFLNGREPSSKTLAYVWTHEHEDPTSPDKRREFVRHSEVASEEYEKHEKEAAA